MRQISAAWPYSRLEVSGIPTPRVGTCQTVAAFPSVARWVRIPTTGGGPTHTSQLDTIAAGKRAAEQGAAVIVFTDPWLSSAVEYGRHVLISHPDAASPSDPLLGASALTELNAAKVVAALCDQGRARASEIEGDHERVPDLVTAAMGPDEGGSKAR